MPIANSRIGSVCPQAFIPNRTGSTVTQSVNGATSTTTSGNTGTTSSGYTYQPLLDANGNYIMQADGSAAMIRVPIDSVQNAVTSGVTQAITAALAPTVTPA